MNRYDMLILEEKSFKPRTLTQWLFYIDRRHVHRIRDWHPLHGVLSARMYRKEALDKAFKNMRRRLPVEVMYRLVSREDALIHYEAWRHARRIGVVEDAVYHIEPRTLKEVIRKFYRYGRTELNLTKYYPELSRKRTPRKVTLHPDSWISLALWFIKAVPYSLGRLGL
jgi:hypothetical protein